MTPLPEAPPKLLLLAHFAARERAVISANAALKDAISNGAPISWRPTFEAHQAARRPVPVPIDPGSADRLRRYAVAALNAEAGTLAEATDGRRDLVFRGVCKLARFITHRALSASELEMALLGAWAACGGETKHGRAFALGAIRRGLQLGRNDPLPVLDKTAIGWGA